MRKGLAVVVVGLLGCSPTGAGTTPEKPAVPPEKPAVPTEKPAVPTVEAPTDDPKVSGIEVHMTAATLADDCGGGPTGRPHVAAEKKKRSAVKGDSARASRSCEQSSIQLAITSAPDAEPADLAVKSVEVLLESGESVGKVTTRSPSIWSDEAGYSPWNEKIEPAQDLSVSYAVTPPDWSQVEDRWDHTYTVKAVLSIGGTEETVEQNVVVDAPTSLPPGVKT